MITISLSHLALYIVTLVLQDVKELLCRTWHPEMSVLKEARHFIMLQVHKAILIHQWAMNVLLNVWPAFRCSLFLCMFSHDVNLIHVRVTSTFAGLVHDSDSDSDSANGLFYMNTMKYISMACDVEYFTVFTERISQRFVELHDSKVNTLKWRQDGRRFADGIFKFHFLQWRYVNFDYYFTEALVQIMA